MIEKGELLEYAQYVENYYGTPKAYVQEQLDAKKMSFWRLRFRVH